ncbi:regulatory protein RecX [Anaerovibrio sp.]|uniref:regulatory protein RecX n=1 Tax=Anaerovibrio sp. TaxID=1872532 RepID=UPI003F14A691
MSRPSKPSAGAQPSCRAKAVELLARSDQSIRRLSEKLFRKGYSEEEVTETVDWLQSKRFIQEEDGCRRRFDFLYNDSSYSVRQIVAKLQQQGYDRDMIRGCIPDDTGEREYASAIKVLRRRFKVGAEPGKMFQHLCMKGFAYDTAQNAVEDLRLEWDEDV